MASLKDLRARIDSVKSTRKITSAMKMVAAAKLRRAQEAAEASRPYAEMMERMLGNLAASLEGQPGAPKMLAGTGSDQKHLILVMTANRGLCGGFNTNIIRAARQKVRELLTAGKDVKIICAGRKGFDALKGEFGSRIAETFTDFGRKQVSFAEADPIAKAVLAAFDDGEADVVTMVYAQFKSAMTQIVTAQQIVPFPVPETDGTVQDAKAVTAGYDYEPSEEALLADLLPRNLSMQIFKSLLENAASEQGARMTAMDNATRNAGEMINKLTLTYNRTRQAQITNELIEIISGAEAL